MNKQISTKPTTWSQDIVCIRRRGVLTPRINLSAAPYLIILPFIPALLLSTSAHLHKTPHKSLLLPWRSRRAGQRQTLNYPESESGEAAQCVESNHSETPRFVQLIAKQVEEGQGKWRETFTSW